MKTRRSKTPLSALSRISLSFLLSVSLPALQAAAQPGEEGPSAFKAMGVVIPPPAPDRSATEGEGPAEGLRAEGVSEAAVSMRGAEEALAQARRALRPPERRPDRPVGQHSLGQAAHSVRVPARPRKARRRAS